MKKNKTIKVIIGISILMILIGSAIAVITATNNNSISKKENNNKITNEKEARALMQEVDHAIFNGSNEKQLKKILAVDNISMIDILTGKDSYLQLQASTELTKQYKLTDYNEKAILYAGNVEKVIKENTKTDFISFAKTVEENALIVVKIKPYYYSTYLDDLIRIQNKLLEYAGYSNLEEDINKIDESDDMEANMFKAKTKAMELLNEYLDNYKNEDEYLETDIILEKQDKNKPNDTLLTYFVKLGGSFTSKTNSFDTQREERVDTYINNAISSGVLDIQNPFKLK